jgi:phenylpropionate dioxygenase-like ring-hydroxylating dioxygenase large terminal subunit
MARQKRQGELRPGPSVQQVLASDRVPPPGILRESAEDALGCEDLPIDAYLSPELHRREIEKLWRRAWQVACREEDIPRVGDRVVYDIGDDSLVVVRSATERIRAFHNACLHRGTRLCDADGHAGALRCPYHGFTWRLDGTLAHVPAPWDFPQLRDEAFRLPEARVELWGGFVFVNFDPGAAPLAASLGDLPRHFERWPLERRAKLAHVGKRIACNWKVAVEAFLEVFHIASVHPESVAFFGDQNSQYDVYPGQSHWSRMLNCSGIPSPLVRERTSEQDALDAAIRFGICEPGTKVPSGGSARAVLASAVRASFAKSLGIDTSDASDSEVLDVIEYFLFPNLTLFGGLSPLCYRVRPEGHDPNHCLFEVMLLVPLPDGAARPPAAKLRWLGPDEPFASVSELGYFGQVLDQDEELMPRVQRGLLAARKPGVTLAAYQESRIRQMRRTLAEYMARP